MKKILPLFLLVSVIAARAVSVVGDFTPPPDYSTTEPVAVVAGNLRLVPGTYTAASWNIDFDLSLLQPGGYTLVATTGVINIGFNIKGPATGSVRITINGTAKLGATGKVDSNVTVLTTGIPEPSGAAGLAPLMNISTRATLAAGQVLTPGFVVGGSVIRRVLIRAIGPGLAGFGVATAARSAALTVFNGAGTQIAANAAWGGDVGLSTIFAGVGAFALQAGSADAAVLLKLPPGNYTARVTGVGEVLVEVYFVD